MAREDNELFTKKINAGSRNYFFDVKKNKDGSRYLTITESKFQAEGEKPERFRILVYEDRLKEFVSGFKETLDFIKNEMFEI
jgi:hypothetical protein